MSELHELSAQDLVSARSSGEVSALELVDHFLDRIDRLNPRANAIVTVTPEHARSRAAQMDRGDVDPGVLWGIPFVDKDLDQRLGVVTGRGTALTAHDSPATVSDPVPQAMDDAGGISLGKSAVCEFGFASYTQSTVFPPTVSPFAPERGAGGSSGGAAAAVSAGLVPCAPGSDGGGSVRIPAWSCGVVGLKPSRGLIPAGTGFDSVGGLVVPGPIARSVADAALVLDALRGSGHTFRATVSPSAAEPFAEAVKKSVTGLRVGVTTRSPWDEWTAISVATPSRGALDESVNLIDRLGHSAEEWDWRPPHGYAEAFITLWRSSAVSLDIPEDSFSLLEPLTRHLVLEGSRVSAAELAQALRSLSGFERAVIEEFSRFDVVITPGLATLPPEVGFYDLENPLRNFEQQVQVTPFTSFVNVCGLPALALPTGSTPEGVPLGIHLIGRPGGEATLLQLGAQLEAELGWRGRRPQIW